MTQQLHIAKGRGAPALPLEAVTQTFGVYGQRGTGKTNTAGVLVEEMVRAGAHVVIFDPVGAWWGITHAGSARGSRGLPGVVLGGDHADVPLEEQGGRLVAELAIGRHWRVMVVDMKLMRKGAQRRFLADALEELYFSNRAALHVVFEEADQVLPQTPRGMDPTLGRVLGAAEDIVKLGRGRGLGATLVSQRFATVNANVREQVGTLLLHRLMGPLDRRAARGWIEAQGDETVTARVLGELASLDVGQAQLYSPGWLRLLERVQIRARRTFDSSATPEVGAEALEPTPRAPVDLDQLRERMADVVERAKANDPRALRTRVAELERALAAAAAAASETEVREVKVEVPVIARERFDVLEGLALDVREAHRIAVASIGETAEQVLEQIALMRREMESAVGRAPAVAVTRPARVNGASAARPVVPAPARRRAPTPVPPADRAPWDEDPLSGPQQRVLDAVAWLESVGFDQPSKIQVGFIAGYRVGKKIGGTFGNILGQLRAQGLIDYPTQGQVALTAAGNAAAHWPEIGPTTEALQAAIFGQLKEVERRVLSVLVEVYPEPLSKQEVGERAGYQVGEKIGGTFGNILGRLRSLGLIDYPQTGMAAALPVLFLDDVALASV